MQPGVGFGSALPDTLLDPARAPPEITGGTAVGVGVPVGVAEAVTVAVRVGVADGVAVDVRVGVTVGVNVGGLVGVSVGVAVGGFGTQAVLPE